MLRIEPTPNRCPYHAHRYCAYSVLVQVKQSPTQRHPKRLDNESLIGISLPVGAIKVPAYAKVDWARVAATAADVLLIT